MGLSFKGIVRAGLSAIPMLGESFAAQDAEQFSADQQWGASKFNELQANRQMQFQKDMSSSAYQRSAADMEKAGLNRILAAGGAASTPSGASASASGATGQAGSGAASSAKFIQSLFNLERDKAQKDIDKTDADIKVAKKQETVLSNTAKQIKEDTEIKKYQKEGARQDHDFEKEWGSKKRKADAIMNYLQKGSSSAADIKKLLMPY